MSIGEKGPKMRSAVSIDYDLWVWARENGFNISAMLNDFLLDLRSSSEADTDENLLLKEIDQKSQLVMETSREISKLRAKIVMKQRQDDKNRDEVLKEWNELEASGVIDDIKRNIGK